MKKSGLSELRGLDQKELEGKLVKLNGELREFRFDRVKGQMGNVMAARRIRRDIARIKTVLREKVDA